LGKRGASGLHFIVFNPAADLLLRLRPKWHDAVFASFAMKLDLTAIARNDIMHPDGDDL
jgi:hypothetical protein